MRPAAASGYVFFNFLFRKFGETQDIAVIPSPVERFSEALRIGVECRTAIRVRCVPGFPFSRRSCPGSNKVLWDDIIDT
jgi:hypothetical protein